MPVIYPPASHRQDGRVVWTEDDFPFPLAEGQVGPSSLHEEDFEFESSLGASFLGSLEEQNLESSEDSDGAEDSPDYTPGECVIG